MAENIENNGCSQRDNAEHEGYVKASRSFNRIWKERDSAQPRLLEAILYKNQKAQAADDTVCLGFCKVRLAAHVSNGLKSRIRPVVGRI